MVPRAVLWVLLAAGAAGFVALALGYEHDPLASLDASASERAGESMPGWLAALARPFSWLGGWIGVTVLCVFVVAVLVRERAWLDLVFFAAVLAGSQIAVAILKAWFDRARPEAGSAVPLPDSAAFPSGHATTGAAVFGAAALLAAERLSSRPARIRLWTAVAVVALAVGLSRVILNVHFVTDVLAGWCLGLAWLASCALVREWARGRRERF